MGYVEWRWGVLRVVVVSVRGWVRAYYLMCRSAYDLLDVRDRAAGSAFRTLVAQGHELVVGDIGTDLAERPLDPLLDLGQVLIDQLRPGCGLVQLAAGSAAIHVVVHRVVRAAVPWLVYAVRFVS